MNFTLRSCVEGWPHSPGQQVITSVALWQLITLKVMTLWQIIAVQHAALCGKCPGAAVAAGAGARGGVQCRYL